MTAVPLPFVSSDVETPSPAPDTAPRERVA